MNTLVENNCITEMACGPNFSYILSDNSTFLSTEYKVLQSQASSCLVKCMKMTYNGNIAIYYLTKSLKSFQSMIPSLDADSFLTIAANIFANVTDVKDNGFLSCQNIDISFEKIFVDPSTYKVQLVYLPSANRFFTDESAFENELRTSLVKLISGLPVLSSPKTMQLMADLSNGMYSIHDIYNRIKGVRNAAPDGNGSVTGGSVQGQLKLVALNAPSHVELTVTKDSYVIGKKADSVDGCVSFNKMISRVHCRIDKQPDGQYSVTDLQSANGTYVNRVRLQPNMAQPIKGGDIVRLANSDFQVVMGR